MLISGMIWAQKLFVWKCHFWCGKFCACLLQKILAAYWIGSEMHSKQLSHERVIHSTCLLRWFVKGCVMVGVVVLSRRFHVNPDNVATPIAASLGDLTTISLLAALARGLYYLVDVSTCASSTSCSQFCISIMPLRFYARQQELL